jgi:cytochrome P450
MDSIQHLMPESISFENPFSGYRKIRKKKKILRVSPTKWLIMGYDVALSALQNPKLSHWEDEKGKIDDGSLKGSVVKIARMFTPDTDNKFRDIIIRTLAFKNLSYNEYDLKEAAKQLLEEFKGQSSFDFIGDFANPFTFGTICKVMGLTHNDSQELYEIIKAQDHNYLRYIIYGKNDIDQENEIYKKLICFVENILEKRRHTSETDDDLMSKLIRESIATSETINIDVHYLCSIILFLIYTGHHNMSNFLGNIVMHLCKNKQTLDSLIFNPDLISKSINEFLRLEGPVHFLMLHAKSDFMLEDTFIKNGSELLVCLGSANRDDSAFIDPDKFCIDRDATKHLSFGYGAYRCIGSKLATMEISAALKALFEIFPNFRLEKNGVVWKNDNIIERGPEKLILKLR